MFGYVKPLRGELKVCEFQTYQAIYCGLCKQLGRAGGQRARFLLSYDMAFLALVALSLSEEEPRFAQQCCIARPTKKRQTLLEHPALEFAADTALLLAYYQCRDQMQDSGFFSRQKYRLALPFAASGKKRAQQRRPQLFDMLEEYEKSQRELESAPFTTLDAACDPTGRALGQMAALLSPEERLTPALYRVGYMMGRYIYLMDAADDLKSDLAHRQFNPLISSFAIESEEDLDNPSLPAQLTEILNLTIGQLAAAYELLPHRRYHTILHNIIYLGLPAVRDRVLQSKTKKEKRHEQSL